MSEKAIAMMGTPGHVNGIAFKSTAEAMRAVGNNTGNLVFQYACYNLVAAPRLIVGLETSWDVAEIRRKCRVVVIPSANFIRENFDLTTFVDFLEKTELPLIFIGLGAQSDDFGRRDLDLHSSIHRLIALIKERAPKVSVRGTFTQEVLERFGVTQTVVTGCPSNFINPSELLPDMVARKLKGRVKSFITHGDEPWPRNPIKQLVERRLTSWTQAGAAMQSQQSVPVFMTYIRRNNPHAIDQPGDHLQESLRKALLPEATTEQFLEYLATKLRVYFSVPQWMEDSSKYDFSVGLRLHGNMVAWQAGTPALWIHHDSRTRELAEAMALPTLPVERFLEECHSVEEAFARAEFDPAAYGARRRELGLRLLEVFDSVQITPTGYLAGLRGSRLADTAARPSASTSNSAPSR